MAETSSTTSQDKSSSDSESDNNNLDTLEEKKYECSHCNFSTDNLNLYKQHKTKNHANKSGLKCRKCPYLAATKKALRRHVTLTHTTDEIAFECPLDGCEYTAKSERGVVYHLETSHSGKSFDCSLCDFKGSTHFELKTHTKSEHVTFECKDCSFVGNAAQSLRYHRLTQHTDNVFVCDLCDYATAAQRNLKNHKEDQHAPCSECAQVFGTKRDLATHIEANHKDQFVAHFCDLCDFNSIAERNLKAHKLTQHKPCETCHLVFKSRKDLFNHIEEKHEDKLILYECDECDYKAKQKGALVNHMETKHSDHVYECDFCDYASPSERLLGGHNKDQHSPCETCGLVFRTKKDLANHVEKNHKDKYVLHKCDLCDFSSIAERNLRQHKFKQHKACEECNIVFNSNKDYLNHIESHHKDQLVLFECEKCDYKAKQKSALANHMETKHSDMTFECDFCDYTSPSERLLNSHNKDQHSPCETCCLVFKTKKDLASHLEKNHKDKFILFKCDLCDFSTIAEKNLKQHKMTQHKSCQECNIVFQSRKDHLNHIEESHKDQLVLFECEKCDYAAKQSGALKAHIESKHSDYLYECDFCDYTSPSQRNINTHNKDQHAPCETCSLVFRSKRDMIKHIETNHNEKLQTYTCDLCDFTTPRIERLKYHKDTIHSDEMHSCNLCDYTSPIKRGLKLHIRDQHSPCEICSIVFNSKKELVSHMETVHKDETFLLHCDVCDYSSIADKNLKLHKYLMHKPCKSCGLVFQTKKDLSVHLEEVHKNEIVLFECDKCEYSSYSQQKVKYHKDTQHSDTIFECDFCEYTSPLKRNLASHNKDQHEPCKLCSLIFSSKRDLLQHMTKEHRNKTHFFCCDICDFTSISEKNLKDHKKGQHTPCEICFEVFLSRRELNEHMDENHSENVVLFKCELCEYEARAKHRIKYHMDTVHSDKEYSCEHCDKYKSPLQRNLVLHQRDQHLPCHLCGHIAKNKKETRRHLWKCKDSKKIKCEFCKFKTMSPDLLAKHHEKKHTIKDEVKQEPQEETIDIKDIKTELDGDEDVFLKCEECSYRTKYAKNMTTHLDYHKRMSQFTCHEPDCEYAGLSARALKIHTARLHPDVTRPKSEPKPAKIPKLKQTTQSNIVRCKLCSFQTDTSKRLLNHVTTSHATQNNGRVYSCLSCSYKSYSQFTYRRHVELKHSTTRVFKCEHCIFECHLQEELDEHCDLKHVKATHHCTICQVRFTNKRHLKTHTQLKHSKVQCGFCQQSVASMELLVEHMKNEHMPKNCEHCDYNAKNALDLRTHMSSSHPDIIIPEPEEVKPTPVPEPKPKKKQKYKYGCEQCSHRATCSSMLKYHIKTRHSNLTFACDECPYVGKFKIELRHHKIKQHRKLECTKCDIQFKEYKKLYYHMQTKHSDVVFECEDCGLKLKSRNDLRIHRTQQHRSLTCEQCSITFETYPMLNYHKKTRHSNLSIKCDTCNYIAINKFDLRKHSFNQHRNNECPKCKKQFKNYPMLNYHMRTRHESSGSFNCEHCNFTASCSAAIKEHMKDAHKDKILNCVYCNYKASSPQMLSYHKDTKHSDKSKQIYKCTECSFKCKSRTMFKYHCKKIHGSVQTCRQCAYVAKSLLDLRKHVQSEHNTFECHICQYKAVSSTALQRHMKTHPDGATNQGFICYECNITIDSREDFLRHIKSQHNSHARNDFEAEEMDCSEYNVKLENVKCELLECDPYDKIKQECQVKLERIKWSPTHNTYTTSKDDFLSIVNVFSVKDEPIDITYDDDEDIEIVNEPLDAINDHDKEIPNDTMTNNVTEHTNESSTTNESTQEILDNGGNVKDIKPVEEGITESVKKVAAVENDKTPCVESSEKDLLKAPKEIPMELEEEITNTPTDEVVQNHIKVADVELIKDVSDETINENKTEESLKGLSKNVSKNPVSDIIENHDKEVSSQSVEESYNLLNNALEASKEISMEVAENNCENSTNKIIENQTEMDLDKDSDNSDLDKPLKDSDDIAAKVGEDVDKKSIDEEIIKNSLEKASKVEETVNSNKDVLEASKDVAKVADDVSNNTVNDEVSQNDLKVAKIIEEPIILNKDVTKTSKDVVTSDKTIDNVIKNHTEVVSTENDLSDNSVNEEPTKNINEVSLEDDKKQNEISKNNVKEILNTLADKISTDLNKTAKDIIKNSVETETSKDSNQEKVANDESPNQEY